MFGKSLYKFVIIITDALVSSFGNIACLDKFLH